MLEGHSLARGAGAESQAMNAPNSLDEKAAERKAYEPSMEEILASIRRIIADDQAGKLAPPKPAAPVPGEPLPVAALSPSPAAAKPTAWDLPIEALRAEPAPPKSTFAAQIEAADEAEAQTAPKPSAGAKPSPLAKPKVEPLRSERLFSPVPRPAPTPPKEIEVPLTSPETDAAVSASFDTLVASQFLKSDAMLHEAIRELLRPMLKSWLDDNLPILVERLVRAEIERVARGR